MCCFSRPVVQVSRTKIFARARDDRQLLAYEMNLASDEDVAMILPLPVPPGSPEDAVRFISLASAAGFFPALDRLFEMPLRGGPVRTRQLAPQAAGRLVVHDVGQFEASYVPTVADFARLAPQFRLPHEVWAELPQYADWGFAVFKLKQPQTPDAAPAPPAPPTLGSRLRALFSGRQAAPGQTAPPVRPAPPPRAIHPMAFEFPRRDPGRLFFPTVHIHDGQVHARADFDHLLYGQLRRAAAPGATPKHDGTAWELSELPAAPQPGPEAELLAPGETVLRLRLRGALPNRDTYLADA